MLKATIKKQSKIFASLVITLIFSVCAQAQTSTLMDGDWSDALIWSGGVPTSTITANVNHNVNLDADIDVGNGGALNINSPLTDTVGGTAHNMTSTGSGVIDINANVQIEGNVTGRNSSSITVNANDTLIIKGDLTMEQSSRLIVAFGGVIIVEGNVEFTNSFGAELNGKLVVRGDLTTRNTAVITGAGNLEVDGKTSINNSSSVFGSTTECTGCEYGSGEGLPVELIEFKASVQNSGQLEVIWKTASEINNDFFRLELAYSDRVFHTVAEIPGSGNSNQLKKYLQNVAVENFNFPVYLKLTQFDFDGKSKEYTPIVVRKQEVLEHCKLRVYPNPTDGEVLMVEVMNLKPKNYQIDLLDSRGVKIRSRQFNIETFTTYYETELLRGMSISNGIYFVRISCNENRALYKVLVQR